MFTQELFEPYSSPQFFLQRRQKTFGLSIFFFRPGCFSPVEVLEVSEIFNAATLFISASFSTHASFVLVAVAEAER